jgi:hypothetical protein
MMTVIVLPSKYGDPAAGADPAESRNSSVARWRALFGFLDIFVLMSGFSILSSDA